jgi:hypothetical protein
LTPPPLLPLPNRVEVVDIEAREQKGQLLRSRISIRRSGASQAVSEACFGFGLTSPAYWPTFRGRVLHLGKINQARCAIRCALSL